MKTTYIKQLFIALFLLIASAGMASAAQWQLKNGWYIEINSSSRGIEGLCVKERESKRYDKTIECKFSNIDSAVNFLEIMIQSDNLQTKISNTQKDLETSKE